MAKNEEHNGCKCSGSKKMDPNAIRLEETTVDFIKVDVNGATHYCFDGTQLSKYQILHNIIVGKDILQRNDQLVVSSKEPILNDINIGESFSVKECMMEDNNFYTVIHNNTVFN
eukprot:Anaeramoba_ignava/a618695_17.p3 GENE.a618695_17~~a618695_17.p3  ORF type:complete len:114 (+),score=2.44 a618695_17:284-625(+)